jgi:hypothetical protein
MDSWLTKGMDWDYWMVEIGNAKSEFANSSRFAGRNLHLQLRQRAVSSVISSLDYSGSRKRVVTTEIEFPTVGQVLLASTKAIRFRPAVHPRAGEEVSIEHTKNTSMIRH